MLYSQLIKEARKYGLHIKGLTYSQLLRHYNEAKLEAEQKAKKSC